MIDISPCGLEHKADWTTLTWHIHSNQGWQFDLRHEVPQAHQGSLADPERGDHALVCVLLEAMRRGEDIRLAGHVCPTLLDHLETLQRIWHRWRPALLKTVHISVDQERANAPPSKVQRALFMYSGGVDATFSLMRHASTLSSRNRLDPAAAMLVHGADIPLDDAAAFQRAVRRAEPVLNKLGIPLIPMRTNSRALYPNWEDAFGMNIAGCMLAMQNGFTDGVLASGEPYERVPVRWGSTPLTDALCSTRSMRIIHDGADFDRIEKVDWLAQNVPDLSALRVCWAGPKLGENCGRCEKCIRTMLNFWASGHPIPPAFPNPLTPALILSVKARHPAKLRELAANLTHAQGHGIKDRIALALRLTIWLNQLRQQRSD